MNEHQISNTSLNFWQDSMDCWRRLPNKFFFFLLLAAWLGLFQFLGNSILGYIHTPSLFSWMQEAYRTHGDVPNNDAHGNFVPFLVVGLFWWKRKELLASSFNIWWPGLLIFVAGMVLHISGYVLQQPRISIVALFTGIYGLMGLAWGREWLRKSFFPFFLFVFSIPLGDQAKFITVPLQLLVSWLTAVAAHVVGIGVMRDGVQLIDPSGTYQYEVAAACSGIRSLIAIFLLATIYGFMTFHSTWKRLFLMALAFPLAVLGNLASDAIHHRCSGTGWTVVGQLRPRRLPNPPSFHLPLIGNEIAIVNLLPYVPAIIGLLWVGRWMEKRWRPDEKEKP